MKKKSRLDEYASQLQGEELTIENPEDGSFRTIAVNEDVIRRYKERLSNFQREWAEYVRNCGSRIFFVNASELLADWNMAEFCREGVLQ